MWRILSAGRVTAAPPLVAPSGDTTNRSVASVRPPAANDQRPDSSQSARANGWNLFTLIARETEFDQGHAVFNGFQAAT